MSKRTLLAMTTVTALGAVGFGGIALAQTEPAPEGEAPPIEGTGEPRPPGEPQRPHGHPFARLLIGFHGEVDTVGPDGEVMTVTYDGGEVTAASDSEITLAQPDETDAVWVLDADTQMPGDPAGLVGRRAIAVDVDGDAVADMILTGRPNQAPPPSGGAQPVPPGGVQPPAPPAPPAGSEPTPPEDATAPPA